MDIKLNELQKNKKAKIISASIKNNKHLLRLAELGLIPGEEIELVFSSFLNKTFVFKIMEGYLCFRKDIAQQILVSTI